MIHNVNEITLIQNTKFFVEKNKKRFEFKLPSISDYLEEDFSIFLTFIKGNDEGKEIKIGDFSFKTRREFIIWALNNEIYRDIITRYFEKYLGKIENKVILLKINDVIIDDVVLDFILDTILVSLNLKKLEDYIKEDKEEDKKKDLLSEFDRRVAEAEAKINKIKENNDEVKSYGLLNVIGSVMMEFGLKKSEVFDMSLYELYWHFVQGVRRANYNMMSTAVAFGSIKIKDWTHYSED